MRGKIAIAAIVAGACINGVAAQAQTEITVMDNQRLRLEVHRSLEPVCEASIGGVDIKLIEGADAGPQYNTQLLTQLNGGSAPDIFKVFDGRAEVAASGFALDITAS